MEISNDIFEHTYFASKRISQQISVFLRVGFLRLRKFMALPYCYFKFVDWNECGASRFQVLKDFLYIFFKLKYYPENYGYCRLWEKKRAEWKYYYGSNYDAYQSYKLGKDVQKKEYQILFKDKEISAQICAGSRINMARVFGVLDPGEDYLSKLKSIMFTSQQVKLIIKPAIGHGGGGVQLAILEGGKIYIKHRATTIDANKFKISERYLVQEFIEQDKELSQLTSSASIRLITLLAKSGEVLFLSGEINTAVNNNFVSNWSAGGVGIGVDTETGKLRDVGYDKYGHKYNEHPTSKIKFVDYTIPKWEEIRAFARKIQESFPYYKLLGPDITLSKDGPILYEINATPDLSSTEQYNGPLLANKKIREEFIRYKLLINNALR